MIATCCLRRKAFTLIELMAVMAVILILMALVIPAFSSMGRAKRLADAGLIVQDQLKLASQLASARNCRIAVRFYKLKGEIGDKAEYRALRLYIYDEKGQNPVAYGSLKKLPDGVIAVSDDRYSTLLSEANTPPPPGKEDLPGAPDTPYKSVEFAPTGGTTLDVTGGPGGDKWFLTLKTEIDQPSSDQPANNFITVMIDPITGHLKVFQP